VAEGVETAAQLAFLQRLDCAEVQGYYHGAAIAAADFQARWLVGPAPA
jgi:EAL domain-containing protein (putative c-di-GMP-specific phosphodiesterase class I)